LIVHAYAAGGPYARYGEWLVLAALLLLVGATAALALAWRWRVHAAVLALAGTALAATQLGLAAHDTMADRFSVEATVAALRERPSGGVPVYAVGMYDHTLPWTLRRTVTMVAYPDELSVEVGWEPRKFIPDLAAFAQRWKADGEAWAFVPVDEVERLRRELGIAMQVMARGPQYAIVKKP
jgi:hypothetical protein